MPGRVPTANPPENFSPTRDEGRRHRVVLTAKPLLSPAPCSLHAPCPPRSKVRTTPCPLQSAGSRPRLPDFQFVGDQQPGANFSRRQRQGKPSPLGLLLRLPPSACSAQIVRAAATLVGGQGPRGRRGYPGALPPSARPLPPPRTPAEGGCRAPVPTDPRGGHQGPPRARSLARSHARTSPAGRGARSGPAAPRQARQLTLAWWR